MVWRKMWPAKLLSLLDTEVWVKENKVWYEHYRKPMANPLLMMEMSAS